MQKARQIIVSARKKRRHLFLNYSFQFPFGIFGIITKEAALFGKAAPMMFFLYHESVLATAAAVVIITAVAIVVADTAECFAAGRALYIIKINGIVEAYRLAAVGAFYLYAVAVVVTAVAIVIVIKTIVATAVAILFCAILAFAIVAFVAVKFIFERAEILVNLFDVLFKILGLVVKVGNRSGKVREKIEYSREKPYRSCLSQELLRDPLYKQLFFGKCHNKYSFIKKILFAIILFFYSFEIFACSCVDAENFAVLDEERNLNGSACFESSGLLCALSRIALETGFNLGNLKLYEHRRLNAEYISLIGNDLAHHFFLYELEVVGKKILGNGNHIVRFHIHEVVEIAVIVGILHISSVNDSGRELVCRAECLFDNSTGNDISQLCADESRALAGLYMLKLDNLHYIPVHFKCNTVFLKIACDNHFFVYLRMISEY